MTERSKDPASFRDPAGFVFYENGQVFRQVNQIYAEHYEFLFVSGLYASLVEKKWLVSHEEIPVAANEDQLCYKLIKPQLVRPISYAYEWTFDMLKDAALLTLAINQLAIKFGMILKDANTYNIQFYEGKPILIDSLSFEIYQVGKPWVAYRQFCQHFLLPLYINHFTGQEAQLWLQIYPDGLPVSLASSLLPAKSFFRLDTLMHVHLQNNFSKKKDQGNNAVFSVQKMLHLIKHIESSVGRLRYKPGKTCWHDYYSKTILSRKYLDDKVEIFHRFIGQIPAGEALDLGANNGQFSLILAKLGWRVVAVDFDAPAINALYLNARTSGEKNILPLLINLVQPTPGTGWDNLERPSFMNRHKSSLVLALALVHHLFFTHNIPLNAIVGVLASLTSRYLIVEFVDATDPKVSLVSAHKSILLPYYSTGLFEAACSEFFTIESRQDIIQGTRCLYLLEKKLRS